MRPRVAIAAVLVLSAFVSRAHTPRAAPAHERRVTTNLAKHCYEGCPKIAAAWRRGDTVLIARTAYSLEVSATALSRSSFA